MSSDCMEDSRKTFCEPFILYVATDFKREEYSQVKQNVNSSFENRIVNLKLNFSLSQLDN